MAIKKKISELPESTDFKGLYTIGVNAINKSVKVSLGYIKDKIDSLVSSVNSVISSANAATASANGAAASANSAASKANTSATNADSATGKANTATTNANNATDAANEAAITALASSRAADNSAKSADVATANANAATQAANTATTNANNATDAANEAATDCREVIEGAQHTGSLNLVPTAMALDYPKHITLGNLTELFIKAVLSPASVFQNVLFLGDEKAVKVTPDGRLTATGVGTSTIHVIPTANTALYKSIQIQVTNPTLRLVNSRTRIHLLGNGNLLLN